MKKLGIQAVTKKKVSKKVKNKKSEPMGSDFFCHFFAPLHIISQREKLKGRTMLVKR